MGDFKDVYRPISTADLGKTPDYAQSINPSTVLKDPRFLKDLREEYESRGNFNLSDDELVRKFYSDRSWAELNTLGAAQDAYEAVTANGDRKARMARIQDVYDQLPFFWQSGGRGAAAIPDIAIGLLADPINAIPGLNAASKGAMAARAARAGGQAIEQSLKAGTKAGLVSGAVSEGAINVGQELIVDSLQQKRDIELGRQDGYETGRAIASAAIGGAIGAGLGGGLGALSGRLAADKGVREADTLTGFFQRPADEAARMPQKEVDAFMAREDYGPIAPQRAAEEPVAPDAPPEDPTKVRIREQTAAVNETYDALQRTLDRQRNDGATQEEIAETQRILNGTARAREMGRRLDAEEAEIRALEASNDPKKLDEAARRRARFEMDYSDFRILSERVMRGEEPEAPAGAPQIGAEAPAPEAPTQAVGAEGRAAIEAPTEQSNGPTYGVINQAGPEAPAVTPAPRQQPQAGFEAEVTMAEGDATAPTTEATAAQAEAPVKPKRRSKKNSEEATPDAPVAAEAPVAEAAPIAAFVRADLRAQLIAEGIDPSTVTPSSKKGKVLPRDVKAAIAARDANAGPDDYALQVQTDLADYIQKAASLGAENDVALTRQIVETFAKANGKNVDDVMSVFDFVTKFDEDMQKSITSKIVDFNNTEQKRIRELVKAEMNRNPALTRDQATLLAQANVLSQRLDPKVKDVPLDADGKPVRKGLFTSNAKRLGVSDKIEQASIYTTAGQGFNSKRISEILRRGMASERRPVTEVEEFYRGTGETVATRTIKGFGLERGENVYPSTSTMARDEAFARAKQNMAIAYQVDEAREKIARLRDRLNAATKEKTVARLKKEIDDLKAIVDRGPPPTIVPYVAERAEVIRGKEYPKGTTLWLDGASGRSYPSMQDAINSRGDFKVASERAPEVKAGEAVEPTTVPSPDQKRMDDIRNLLAQYADNPAEFVRAAEALVSGKSSPATTKEVAAASITGQKGDRLLIARSKTNPNDVRMVSPKQAAAGADIRSIIGKSGADSDPANWEVRYASANDHTYNPRRLAEVFERAEPTDVDAPGMRSASGNATGVDRALTVDEFNKIGITDLTGDEANAIAFAIGSTPQTVRAAAEQGKLQAGYLHFAINKMEYGTKSIPQTIDALNTFIRHLETLYGLESRIAPQGYIMPSADRASSVKTLQGILSGYDADTVAQATKFLQRLGGDPRRAPIFSPSDNGWVHNLSVQNDTVGVPKSPDAQQGAIIPIAKLYHEVFHWAYKNILTPEDRLEFWSAMRKYYDGKTGKLDMDALSQRVPLENDSGALNALENFQEFAANQFSMWATRGKSAGVFNDANYWRRMANYMKAIFDRYFFKAPIDPDLEPLFAKVLPDNQRSRFQEGRGLVGQSFGERQKFVEAIDFRYRELQLIKTDLHTAMQADSANGIITAFEQMRSYLAGVASGRTVDGTFSPLKKLDKMIRDRLLDINEIMSGAALPEGRVISAEDAATFTGNELTGGARVMADPERVADLLVDLYDNGHAGDFKPVSGRGGDINFTPLSKLVELMEYRLEEAFMRETRRLPSAANAEDTVRIPASKDQARADRRVRQAVKEKVAEEAAQVQKAEAVAKTPRNKRDRTPVTSANSIDPAVAPSTKNMSLPQLLKEFEVHKGTQRGDQLAVEVLNKQRAKALPAKAVPVSREIFSAKTAELEQQFFDALREGGPANKKLLDQLTYEMQRRAANAGRKKEGLPPIKPMISRVQDSIANEIADNVGLASDDGIPPSARANVREAISYITHRDPEVQYAARTMLYRMMNLMGKTVRDTLGDTNIFSAQDVARLAGENLNPYSTGVFADFRSPEYKNLRSDLRRMAIGLTKGISTPFDAVHEIGHVIVRGVLDQEDTATIARYYSQADDKIKKRIESAYGSKYADLSPVERDEIFAEEWFAESLVNYLGERVARGDMFDISASGRMTEISLRGKLDMLVDKVTEYISYVVNGLIGRDDIKQEFRRLMFYGDMFAKKRPTVLHDAFGDMVGVPQHLAADYARETIMMAPKSKVARILEFVGNGSGLTPDGQPRVFYHATPNGSKLRKEVAPDAALKPSLSGKQGPGIYVSDNPAVGEQIYTKPRAASLLRQIDELNVSDEVSNDLYNIVRSTLPEVRNNLDRANRGIQYLTMDLGKVDDVGREVLMSDISTMRQQAAALSAREAAIVKTLSKYGVEVDGLVLPVYVRALNSADFTRQARYYEDDPFIGSLVEYVTKRDLAEPEEVRAFVGRLTGLEVDGAPGVRGSDVWEELVDLFGNSDRAVAALTEMGYDSIKTTHINEINQDGQFGAVAHTVLNIFDSSNVKHVEADYFDYNDARLYFRDFEGEAKGLSSDLTRGLITGQIDKLDNMSPLPTLEQLEAQGISSPVIDAVASIWRKRALTEREEQAVRKVGIGGLIMSQSARMSAVGAHWMAKRYEDFFPTVYQLFGKKFFPLRDAMLKLPDAANGIGMWFRRATGGAIEQPKSYSRIVKALRYGEGSRQEKALSNQEREVWRSIRSSFRAAFDEMRQAGVIMGDRGFNYFPQVWNGTAIQKDRAGFLNAMVRYYEVEQMAKGLPFKQDEANKFAEGLYAKFTDDSDTAYFPIHASRRNATSDNIDYSRIIELDKYPGMIAELEPYLESNLEAILVKYHEGAARRLHQTRTWGVNSHGFFDYMHVADQGIDGIARLLSSNKEFRKDIRSITPDGYVDVSTLRDVVRAPFEEDYAGAKDFAERLVEVYASKGEGAARQLLKTIAPKTDRGLAIPAFTARSEAILGAIRDYGGIGGKVEAKEFDLMEDALRVSLKQPLTAPSYGGETALHASRVLRQFNSLTLLGFTTLTSFSDLALPLIRSGEFKAWYSAMRQMAQDPDYARLIRQTGVAAESIVHENMSNLFGGQSARVTNAFFNATLLTPWTEMNRKIAGATGYETFKVMQDRAFRYYKDGAPIAEQPYQYKQAHRFLSQYGLADYLPAGAKGMTSIADRALLESDDTLRTAIIKFADQAVFQPNANDIPLWAQTPIGALLFQLKSYPLMMARMGKEVLVNDIKALWKGEGGDPRRAMYFLALGPAFGMGALALKDIIQARGGEENNSPELRKRNILKVLGYDKEVHGDENDFLGWYAEGFMTMGGLGLLFEMIHDIAAQVDNGAYGKVRVASTVLGPSAGTMFSAMDVAAGVFDSGENSNAKERSAVREAVGRIPIAGQVKGFREMVVDAFAGEQEGRGGSGGWTSSWGSGWK